jgi:hypothetical protein
MASAPGGLPAGGVEIVVPGNVAAAAKDYYCHVQLGGCGCVWKTTEKPATVTDGDNDLRGWQLKCPSCKRIVPLNFTTSQGICYGFIDKALAPRNIHW